jgi:hypothetical protein
VVITSNYKSDGMYLPAEDRRTYCAWSNLTKEEFEPEHFDKLHYWFDHQDGNRYVTAYLHMVDLEGFDPKAPPPRTAAFWDIVGSHASPEVAELGDVLEAMGNPAAVTLDQVVEFAMTREDMSGTVNWLVDRKNRWVIRLRAEKCGYRPAHNPQRVSDGLWKIKGKSVTIYARTNLDADAQLAAARALAGV